MKNSDAKVVDSLELKEGLQVDLDEGWPKVISRQKGGDPGRCFGELIQNLLDSYPVGTPWEERKGDIHMSDYRISIIDYGEGLDRKRLRLLVTLGGTDKEDNPLKIGTFGIGFFSIFNPKLGTKKVIVTTRCEGQTVEVVFTVLHPEKRPMITMSVLNNEIPYSTKIEVVFDNRESPKKCLQQSYESLNYYPCRVLVNGEFISSVWEKARQANAHIFKEGPCQGFLTASPYRQRISLLCKYEHIIDWSLPHFITGGHGMDYDLRDYHRREVPYVPGVGSTLNSMNLRLTIGRDSFFMDSSYELIVKVLAKQLLLLLGQKIDAKQDTLLIISNQYILRKQLRGYLKDEKSKKIKRHKNPGMAVIRKLAKAKVYRLNGRNKFYSVADIHRMKSKSKLPLYYSPLQTNLRWLGGAFKHDFIILPPPCNTCGGAPDLYDSLFGALFDDTINLDTIVSDQDRIRKLVERGIVDKKALTPKCQFIGQRDLPEKEIKFLKEIDDILNYDEVRSVIEKHLHFTVVSIQTTFFEVEGQDATIATGLFDQECKAWGEEVQSNLISDKDEKRFLHPEEEQRVLLGLNRAHPLINDLMESKDPQRAYYALTFLAHELTLCQKRLAPYSQFYHIVKERLANDMRRALMTQLTQESEEVTH